MRSPRVRLQDVAARAGVSVRTVSNVVNDFTHVAPDTRARVQAAVDELGYRPNLAARGLRSGRSGVVGLVVPEIDSPYFADLASRMARLGEERGWVVHIAQTDGDADRERRLIAGLLGQDVDGVVVSPWSIRPDEARPRPDGPPVVLLGERASSGGVDRVAIDNVAAAREAVEHLLANGRRRVAAVGLQPHLANDTAVLRVRGHREALAAGDLAPAPELEVVVDRLHRADGAAAAASLLERGVAVDALFCFTDQLALGALRALADAGVRVPDDVALVGVDDIEDGRYAVPSLTTVAPDKDAIVRMALDALDARLGDAGDAPAADLVAPHRLVVRESSGGPGPGPAAGR